MPLSGGRGDGVSNGDVQGVARSTQRVDQIGVRGRHKVRARHTKDYGSTADSRIEISGDTRSCYSQGETTQGSSKADCDTNAATADSGENEVRRRNMRECEHAMMESP